MKMTIGQKIAASRKLKGIRGERLGEMVALSKGAISKIENDQLKGGPDPDTVVRIATALQDDTILLHYLETNPVYQAVIPKIFPDLNNIRRDPAIIFSRLAKEADESMQAAMVLAELFSNADPRNMPNFAEVFRAKMEQIIDIKRCVEILELELIASGAMTDGERRDIYERQQAKCEARGHHKPELESCSLTDRRQSPGRRAANGG